MHILHMTDDFHFTGGIQSYMVHLQRLLEDRGHEVTLYSGPQNRGRVGRHLTRWLSPSDYLRVKDLIEKKRPDLVHAHSVSMNISPLPCLAAVQLGIPVLMTVHDFGYVCHRKWMMRRHGKPCTTGFDSSCLLKNCPSNWSGWHSLPYQNLRWLKIAFHRALLRRWVRVFICPSLALTGWMRDNLNLGDVVCIPNFVMDPGPVESCAKKEARITFMGRLSPEKGVDCLLRAMAQVKQRCPSALLVIAGDGPQREELKELSGSLGLGESVRFLGELKKGEVMEAYKGSSLSVLPSLWMENCPVSAIEALAMGVPMVASRIGGIPEIVSDRKTGFLFSPNDHAELAEKLVLLLERDDLRKRFSEASRKRYETRFGENLHCEAILSLYARLLQPSLS